MHRFLSGHSLSLKALISFQGSDGAPGISGLPGSNGEQVSVYKVF